MVEVDGETYHNASDAIRFLRVSRWKFYNTLRGLVTPYQTEICKRPLYKQSDLEALKVVRVKNG